MKENLKVSRQHLPPGVLSGRDPIFCDLLFYGTGVSGQVDHCPIAVPNINFLMLRMPALMPVAAIIEKNVL
jgi:hypothetical protein